MRTRSRAATTVLLPAAGEDLCLAFANTLSWRGSPAPSESLAAFADLFGWLAGAASLPTETVEMAQHWSPAHRQQAAALFGEAIGLREAIYRLFSALASA